MITWIVHSREALSNMPKIQTLGQILINDAIPEDMRDDKRVFNKKTSSEFFQELAEKHPDEYVDVLKHLTDVSRVVGTEYGGPASISLSDLKLPPRIREYRKQLKRRVAAIAQNPGWTKEQKNEKIIGMMRKAMPTIQKNLQDEVFERDNAFGEQIKHGFRGNPVQMTQLMFGDMLVADHKGDPLPIPGMHGYGEGVTPTEFWAGSYGSRKGYSDVQFATAQTGFLGKQLAGMANRLKITGDDCGAKTLGIEVDGDDAEVMGAVLARDVGGLKAGTVVEKQHLPQLRGEQFLVRSHVTCQQEEGVCKKCSGKRDQGEYPPMGSYVGINSARVVSEPMTQELGLSAKHLGGVVGVNDQNVAGFDEINQFLQVPKNFRGAAVLAPADGKVRKIYDAPQGGKYIKLDSEEIYVPNGREIDVKVGDEMEAGDAMTDGTPNPGEIVKHKGLGGGRQYFTSKFYDILKKNGVPTHRRNVETLARAFFDKVRVTRPEGFGGFSVGDVVSYSDIQRGYKPRTGAQARAPKRSLGSFLEEPVLHYTIGTRVTPSVVNRLKKYNIDNIITHDEEPGFSPEVIRLMGMAATDKDWKTQLSGFGLKKSFLQSARKGSKSMHQNTSYVGQLMDPSRLGKEGGMPQAYGEGDGMRPEETTYQDVYQQRQPQETRSDNLEKRYDTNLTGDQTGERRDYKATKKHTEPESQKEPHTKPPSPAPAEEQTPSHEDLDNKQKRKAIDVKKDKEQYKYDTTTTPSPETSNITPLQETKEEEDDYPISFPKQVERKEQRKVRHNGGGKVYDDLQDAGIVFRRANVLSLLGSFFRNNGRM